jgi:hypothetical protein
VAAFSPFPPKEGHPALLTNRLPIDGRAAAYLCRGFTCLQPVTDADEFARQVALEPNE